MGKADRPWTSLHRLTTCYRWSWPGNSKRPRSPRCSSPPWALNHVDCEAVIKGARRVEAWCTDPTRPYADLWKEWWDAHRAKGDGPECLWKVKAHPTAADIRVKISAIDRLGNDLTDG